MIVSITCSLLLLALSDIGAVIFPSFDLTTVTDQLLGTESNFLQFAKKLKLDIDEHEVETEDGYLLKVFRVRKQGCKGRGTPVVLQHGLLLDAFCWIASGAESPGALIASTCVDLWLPNARGSRYSRKHRTLFPTQRAFWQFSVDEIGRYDVPAVVDYVLAKTNHIKLNYIGFSQGGGSFFIMCSELPQYCKKIGVMIGLAPATRHFNAKSQLFRVVMELFNNVKPIIDTAMIYEVLSHGGAAQELLNVICPISNLTLDTCGAGKDIIASSKALHPESVTREALKEVVATFPAGTSVQNMARYGQSVQCESFQKYDYGSERNKELYGTSTPPVYNFSSVSTPVVVLYGDNDGIVDKDDVEWTFNQLPNVLETSKVNDSLWNHFDMTYSKYFKDLVFPTIEKYLKKFAD